MSFPDDERSWWSQQWTFTRKELRETLRDRRTIVTLIAMPLLLYPLLGLVFRLVALQSSSTREGARHRVVISSEREGEWLREVLRMVSRRESSGDDRGEVGDVELLIGEPGPDGDFRSPLAQGEVELGVRIQFPDERRLEGDGPAKPLGAATDQDPASRADRAAGLDRPLVVQLFQRADSASSREAREVMESRLQSFNMGYLLQVVTQAGLPPRLPVLVDSQVVEVPKPRSTGMLGLLPLILLLMTVTGGVYPAIDLTAGERERDTLETLFALPVPRVRLLLAKYVAVLVVIMLTGIANLLAMSTTIYALQLEKQLFGDAGFTWILGARLIVVLVVFGMFYASVLLALTSAARSFKEAQAYLIPLMLLSLAPGLVILLPGWHLDGVPAVLPLLNMLLLARDLIEGQVDPLAATAALISTGLYTSGALAVAAKWFAADAVAVGSRSTWSELWRRPSRPETTPTLSGAIFALSVIFPLYFFASGILGRWLDGSPAPRLIVSSSFTILLFAGLPALVMTWLRVPLRSAWALRRAPLLAWPAAVLLGLGSWPLVYELIVILQQFGVQAMDDEKRAMVERLLVAWKAVPLPLLVFALGVLPGVCEELFFRGVLFGGVRRVAGGRATVVITALAFGLFHVVLAGGAAPERLAPSTILGVLLGVLRLRSHSCLPGIVTHVTHNSSLLLLAASRDQLALAAWNAESTEHLPGGWITASLVAIVVGVAMIWFSRAKDSEFQGRFA